MSEAITNTNTKLLTCEANNNTDDVIDTNMLGTLDMSGTSGAAIKNTDAKHIASKFKNETDNEVDVDIFGYIGCGY